MIRKRLKAVEGLVAQFDYVARRHPGAALRLVDAVERTLKMLEKMPGLGRSWGEPGRPLHQIRVRGVVEFDRFRVFCREIDGGIEWLAIQHTSQDDPDLLDEGEPTSS